MPIDWSVFAIPKGTTRYEGKKQKRAEEAKAMRECFQAVDQRDGYQCRVCKRACGGITMLERAHHHHVNYRSMGGQHTTDNVVRICAECHAAVHDAKLRLEGNADERNEMGRLAGIKVSRLTDSGWQIDRFV